MRHSTAYGTSAHEARALVVKGPAGDQVLHRSGVVTRAEPVGLVQRMRLLDGVAVDLDPKARPVGNGDLAAFDLERLFRQCLAVLPDPVGVDRGDLAGSSGADMGEHGQ